MKKKLKITLKSDLNVASGYSYAGIVDSDICYDDYGLPYIPSRRLKGCFRETAEDVLYGVIEQQLIDNLFGVSGAKSGGSLRISNARLKDYSKIKNEIQTLKSDKEIGRLFTQQNVLGQYTRVIAQTAIGVDGFAKDKSLRYTRVVNHYLPSKNNEYEETVFEAEIEYADIDEETVKLVVGATKNIGLKRNRGLGAVHCSIDSIEDDHSINASVQCGTYDLNKEYVIIYSLINEEPLMLSQLSDSHSEKYISGQTILGHLAGRYLADSTNRSDSDEFSRLFLDGTTKYVNAYPANIISENNVRIYYPAPLNINKLKKTKDYVDAFYLVKVESGNQPKKLKGKYVSQEINDDVVRVRIKDVDMKLHYHHSKADESNEADHLYPSEAIEPDQSFVGEIYTKGNLVGQIRQMLEQKDFLFGKSKGAQYGHCECKILSIEEADSNKDNTAACDKVLITLLTDAVFIKEGEFTVEADAVMSQLASCIGGSYTLSSKNIEDFETTNLMMETGLVSGYQTTWNMHKPLYPVVKAGSCFIIDLQDVAEIPEKIWVGTKNQEGFGYASVVPMKQRNIKIEEPEAIVPDSVITDGFRKQCINILKKALLDALLENSITLDGISKTQIGRVILMLKQCNGFADFKDRIDSIKTEAVKKELRNKIIKPVNGDNGEADISRLIKEGTVPYYCSKKLMKLSADDDLSDLWKDYMLYRLTICKYEAKEA